MARLILLHPLKLDYEQQGDKAVFRFSILVETQVIAGDKDRCYQIIDKRDKQGKGKGNGD